MVFSAFLVLVIVGITTSLSGNSEPRQTPDQQIRLSNKVRNYLLFGQQQADEINEQQPSMTWLTNSNKLGLSYNPVIGDPVCYTGDCQMAGFGRPVFKFKYTNAPTGSCTTKLIPEHTEVSTQYQKLARRCAKCTGFLFSIPEYGPIKCRFSNRIESFKYAFQKVLQLPFFYSVEKYLQYVYLLQLNFDRSLVISQSGFDVLFLVYSAS